MPVVAGLGWVIFSNLGTFADNRGRSRRETSYICKGCGIRARDGYPHKRTMSGYLGDVPGGGGFSALSVALSTTWKAIVQRSVRTD